MEVVDQEYYHVHRLQINASGNKYSNKWVVGNTLVFGNSPNLLCDRVNKINIDVENERALINHLVFRFKQINTVDQKKQVQTNFMIRSSLLNYLQFIREMILESVRCIHFPEKPSRLSGVWLSERNHIKKWTQILADEHHVSKKIFVVKFTGNIHKGDERWITNKNLSFDSYHKNAMGYWSGSPKSLRGKAIEEVIGAGTLKIVEEVIL